MNRFDRIIAIFLQLQAKKVIVAHELAKRFGVSLRTIYRDVRSLEEAGVPICSEAGVGYSLLEGFKLPPIMFSKEEALAFIAAEKLISRFAGESLGVDYISAINKVKAVLKNNDKDYLEHIEDRIVMLPYGNLPKAVHMVSLQFILDAIAENQVLDLKYFADHSQKITIRKVEPIGVFLHGENWHLLAFCKLRNDYRDFRLDRIQSAGLSGEKFEGHHPGLDTLLPNVNRNVELQEVVISVPMEYYKHIGSQKYYHGFIDQEPKGEYMEMKFMTASLEGIARWYIMLGDRAFILKPEALKSRVREIVVLIQKNI